MSYPNQEQAAVLSHLDGTLLILAPAGTGKTRLMADRLAPNQGVWESRPHFSSFNLQPPTSDLRPPTSDLRPPTFDLRPSDFQTFDIPHLPLQLHPNNK